MDRNVQDLKREYQEILQEAKALREKAGTGVEIASDRLTYLERVTSFLQAFETTNATYQKMKLIQDPNSLGGSWFKTYGSDITVGLAEAITGIRSSTYSKKHGEDIGKAMGLEGGFATAYGLFADITTDPTLYYNLPGKTIGFVGRKLIKPSVSFLKEIPIVSKGVGYFGKTFNKAYILTKQGRLSQELQDVYTFAQGLKAIKGKDGAKIARNYLFGTSRRPGALVSQVYRSGQIPANIAQFFEKEFAQKPSVIQNLAQMSLQMGARDYLKGVGAASLKGYDKLLNMWKKSVTVFFPAFKTRNLAYGVWSNLIYGGVANPMRYVKKTGDVISRTGKVYTAKEVETYIRIYGIKGQAGRMDVKGGWMRQQVLKGFDSIGAKRAFTFFKTSVDTHIENTIRIPLFRKMLEEGKTPFEAYQVVKKLQGEYRNSFYPPAVQAILRLWPFGKFDFFNVPLTVKGIFNRYSQLSAFSKTTNVGRDEKEQPGYVRDVFHWGKNVWGNIGTGFEDVWRLAQHPVSGIAQKVTPFLSVPTERALDWDFFAGKPISTNIGAKAYRHMPDWFKALVGYRETSGTGIYDKKQSMMEWLTGKKSSAHGRPVMSPGIKHLVESITSRFLSTGADIMNMDLSKIFTSIRKYEYGDSERRGILEMQRREEKQQTFFAHTVQRFKEAADSIKSLMDTNKKKLDEVTATNMPWAFAGTPSGDKKPYKENIMGYTPPKLVAQKIMDQWSGIVTAIDDGDTFRVRRDKDKKEFVIRLSAANTPEKEMPFYNEATDFTRNMIMGKAVNMGEIGTDKYGRTIATTGIGGKDLASELISAGLARHYVRFNRDPILGALENEAKAGGKGIWSDPNAWKYPVKGTPSIIGSDLRPRPMDEEPPFSFQDAVRTMFAGMDMDAAAKEKGFTVGQMKRDPLVVSDWNQMQKDAAANIIATRRARAEALPPGKERGEAVQLVDQMSIALDGIMKGLVEDKINAALAAAQDEYAAKGPGQGKPGLARDVLKIPFYQGKQPDDQWFKFIEQFHTEKLSKAGELVTSGMPEGTTKINYEAMVALRAAKRAIKMAPREAQFSAEEQEFMLGAPEIMRKGKMQEFYRKLQTDIGQTRNVLIEAEQDPIGKLMLQQEDEIKDFMESDAYQRMFNEGTVEAIQERIAAIYIKYANLVADKRMEIALKVAQHEEQLMKNRIQIVASTVEAAAALGKISIEDRYGKLRETTTSEFNTQIAPLEALLVGGTPGDERGGPRGQKMSDQQRRDLERQISDLKQQLADALSKLDVGQQRDVFQLGQAKAGALAETANITSGAAGVGLDEFLRQKEAAWQATKQANLAQLNEELKDMGESAEKKQMVDDRALAIERAHLLDQLDWIKEYWDKKTALVVAGLNQMMQITAVWMQVDKTQMERISIEKQNALQEFQNSTWYKETVKTGRMEEIYAKEDAIKKKYDDKAKERNKSAFAMMKALQIAEAVAKGPGMVLTAWKTGLEIGSIIPIPGVGFAIGAAMAATAAALVSATVAQIAASSPGYDEGGLVQKKDTLLLRGSPGEYMMNDKAVDHYGVGVMNAINDQVIPKDGYGLPDIGGGKRSGTTTITTERFEKESLEFTNINFLDPIAFEAYLNTLNGQRRIVNLIGQNRTKVKAALAG